MTAPYTRAQLEAMAGCELDAAVAEVLFGFTRRYSVGFLYSIVYLIPPDYPLDRLPPGLAESCPFDNGHQFSLDLVPAYSTTWDGLGQVVERMREMRFEFDAKGLIGSGSIASFHNLQAEGSIYVPGNLPRATAIAAVLASQGAAHAL